MTTSGPAGTSAGGTADRIVLQGMRFFGRHGSMEAERTLGGSFDVDIELRADLRAAGRSDRLEDTIDYSLCFDVVRTIVEEHQYTLLEAVAESIASSLLEQPRLESVLVRVAKRPPLPGLVTASAVVIERSRALG